MSCSMGESLQSAHARKTTYSSVPVALDELPEDMITLLKNIADTICRLPAPERARLKRDPRSNASAKAEWNTPLLSDFTLAPKKEQESKASEQLLFKQDKTHRFEIAWDKFSRSQNSAVKQACPQALEPEAESTWSKDGDVLFWSLLSAYDSILTTGTVVKGPAKFDAATQNRLLEFINDNPSESPLLSWEQYKAKKASGAGTGFEWKWAPLRDDDP